MNEKEGMGEMIKDVIVAVGNNTIEEMQIATLSSEERNAVNALVGTEVLSDQNKVLAIGGAALRGAGNLVAGLTAVAAASIIIGPSKRRTARLFDNK